MFFNYLCVFFSLIAFFTTFVASDVCENSSICLPWLDKGPFCRWGKRLPVFFYARYTYTNVPTNFRVFSFCHIAGNRAIFNLSHVFDIPDSINVNFDDLSRIELFFDGIPKPFSKQNPLPFFENNGIDIFKANTCLKGKGKLVTNFLRFKLTLLDGKLIDAEENSVSLISGFYPSCGKDGKCNFNHSHDCLGENEKSNCAICISTEKELINKDLIIWLNFYGSDSKGYYLSADGWDPSEYKMFTRNFNGDLDKKFFSYISEIE